jgi:NADPH:quinone reductase-like Zn-dependent oxidoreductase
VLVESGHLTGRPPNVPWEVAGALFIAGVTAYAAVRAVAPAPGDTVAVSAAAGGVGSLAVQLAKRAGASVVGIAGDDNFDWLRERGVMPVAHGAGLDERLRAAAGAELDAFVDTFGGGYVDLAIALGVAPERINTIINYEAVERLGVKGRGTHAIASAAILAELTALVASGDLEIPIARTFPLDQVGDAFRELADRHTHGKIVLVP